MAIATPELIQAFRKTLSNLKNGAVYQWGHMGACNCGNLAQELTKLSKAEIHRYAMQRIGDWSNQLLEFCPTSGYPIDLMITGMLDFGLTLEDLKHLEYLSDPAILHEIPLEKRELIRYNNKQDLILYLETWLGMLENEWVQKERPDSSEFLRKIKPVSVLS